MVLPQERVLLTETITNLNRDATESVSHCYNHIVGTDVYMY